MDILFNQRLVSEERGLELCQTGESGIVVIQSDKGLQRAIHMFDDQVRYREWVSESSFADSFLAADLFVDFSAESSALPQMPGVAHRSENLAVLYSSEGYRGRWSVVDKQCFQNLSTIGFFDNVQSLRVTGTCLLTDAPNFQGRRLYIVGEGLCEIPELASLGFGSRASSFLAF